MTQTSTIMAPDGARIAYDVCGKGPALMLLHGFGGTRQTWHDCGWVTRLSTDFTVITVDLRGCGESDALLDPARYSPASHLSDLHAIADACDATRFVLVGFSWGATVTRNVAAQSDQVSRAVLIGTYFGHFFTEQYLATLLDHYGVDPVMAVRVNGLRAWPGVAPADLRPPALVITGTQDGNVVNVLREQRAAIESAGVQLLVFDNLDHSGLVESVDTVLPPIRAFLAAPADSYG